MSLTADEIKEILELYGKGYSYQRIADVKGYSTATIRKYLKLAKSEVLKLKVEGLEAEQIANQLDYPPSFVSRVLKEDEAKNKIKTEVEVEVREDVEQVKKPKKSDIKTEWSEFQRGQEIEQRKEEIRREVNESIECLEVLRDEYERKEVSDENYYRRQEEINSVLDFILAKVEEVDSIEDISSLESIFKEIDQKSDALIEEYDKKVSDSKKLSKNREKKRSDQLLSQEIDIPLVPDFVRDFVKSSFTVKTEEEATIVKRALFEWDLCNNINNRSEEEGNKLWHAFIGIAKEGRWDYLNMLASKFQGLSPHA